MHVVSGNPVWSGQLRAESLCGKQSTLSVRGEQAVGGREAAIDRVPAEACSVCRNVPLKPDTVRRIEELATCRTRATRTAPVYDCA